MEQGGGERVKRIEWVSSAVDVAVSSHEPSLFCIYSFARVAHLRFFFFFWRTIVCIIVFVVVVIVDVVAVITGILTHNSPKHIG